MATTQEAPERLEVVRKFVNTFDVEQGKDDLSSAAALRRWFADHELGSPDVRGDDLENARGVREALRALTLENNGAPADESARPRLREAAARAQLTPTFGDGGLAARATGADRALGELLAVVHEAMADGTWQRLKACGEHTCQWAFYDTSKNRSGNWCSMAVCGNRAKARAYRERSRTRR
jgi:predicted RNA-binding Zn ribbon-like protein